MNFNKKTSLIIFLVSILIILIASIGSILYNNSLTFNLRKSDNFEYNYVLSVKGRSGTEIICNTYRNGEMVVSRKNSLSYFRKTEFYFKTKFKPKIVSGKMVPGQKIILFSDTINGVEECTELIVNKVIGDRLSPEETKNQKLLEAELNELKSEKAQKEKDQAIKNKEHSPL